jgi:Icc protein
MSNIILKDENEDGLDRRGFLKCMAWAGTGMLWIMNGGMMKAYGMSQLIDRETGNIKSGLHLSKGDFSFVQISDSHIGFSKEANPDVVGTLQAAIGKINALPTAPSFLLHTGDLSHLSKAEEFDTLDQVLKTAKSEKIFFVPGEHDVLTDNGKQYLERYGKGTQGTGWYSFDSNGVHFIGLVNVVDLKAGGLGYLGDEQIEWLEKDVKRFSASTPIVVFAHMPLWSVYPSWGWGTDDSARALSYLKRFGSVTVLNGHIHQTMQKIEGNITFHTAMSTAFVQPQPGMAPSPGPMKVPAERLRSLLGLSAVNYMEHGHTLAITDMPLISELASNQVIIDNFSFTPQVLTVSPGTKVTWTNRDEVPHTVTSTDKRFTSSKVLDTDGAFSNAFNEKGIFDYYCTVHPHMTGKIIVK